MDKLGLRERGQLKSLLAGESLPTDAQNSIINILRTDLPDFFSQLTSGLEKIKSANNNEVAKYLKLNTGKTRQILKKQKLAFLTQQEQNELGSALEEPVATGGVVYEQGRAPADQSAPISSSGGGGGMPGMPSMGGISSPSARPFRVVRNVPQVEKPDIAVANSSGHVTEAGNPSKLVSTTSTGQIKEVGQPSKLIVPGTEKGDPSKLVSARSDGSIIQTAPKNPTIHIADKSGNVVKSYNIKSPSALRNFGSNLGSTINRGLNRGVNKAISSINKFNPGGIGGGSRSILGRFKGLGKGGSKGMSSLSKIGKSRGKWAFVSILLGMMLLTGILAISGTSSTGEAAPLPPGTVPPPINGSGCPDTSVNRTEAACRYLNPSINIFDTSISSSSIKTYIDRYSPVFINAGKGDLTEFTKRTNYIIDNAKQSALNPAIFLGYWKSESNFSTAGSRDMGCLGDNFYEQVDCALGINTFSDPAKNPIANCARSKDAGSAACTALKSLRQTYDTTNPVAYPINAFDDFAESYGPYGDLLNGLHTNCTHTYNDLLDVAKELNACTTTPAGGTVPPPLADGNYKKWLEDYRVKISDGFVSDVYQWAYEVLVFTASNNPKFKTLLGSAPIEVKPTCRVSITQDRTINLRNRKAFCIGVSDSAPEGPTSDINLFKHTLIHELGHVIYNMDRTNYNARVIAARNSDVGFLTLYPERASSDEFLACGAGDDNGNRADEDFAESISYFINKGITTQDYGCGIRSEQLGINPFDQQQNGQRKYSAHYQFMTELLK